MKKNFTLSIFFLLLISFCLTLPGCSGSDNSITKTNTESFVEEETTLCLDIIAIIPVYSIDNTSKTRSVLCKALTSEKSTQWINIPLEMYTTYIDSEAVIEYNTIHMDHFKVKDIQARINGTKCELKDIVNHTNITNILWVLDASTIEVTSKETNEPVLFSQTEPDLSRAYVNIESANLEYCGITGPYNLYKASTDDGRFIWIYTSTETYDIINGKKVKIFGHIRQGRELFRDAPAEISASMILDVDEVIDPDDAAN